MQLTQRRYLSSGERALMLTACQVLNVLAQSPRRSTSIHSGAHGRAGMCLQVGMMCMLRCRLLQSPRDLEETEQTFGDEIFVVANERVSQGRRVTTRSDVATEAICISYHELRV